LFIFYANVTNWLNFQQHNFEMPQTECFLKVTGKTYGGDTVIDLESAALMGHITVKTSRIAGSLQAACSQALFEAAFGLPFPANKPAPQTRGCS
jgi:hypothetical protein